MTYNFNGDVMKISDLQDKVIINIKDGKNIGKIVDLEISETGKILNFYAMPRKLFYIFSSNKETIFTINDIKKIGKDVILVEL